MAEPIVTFSHVSMQFPGVLANDDVSLSIMPGEVFALVGENGAGKSTLINILFGINTPSAGTLTVRGKTVKSLTSAKAIEMGIGMVHQHFMLVPSFTVAQNIVLGDEPHAGPFYRLRQASAVTRKLTEEYGLQVPPDEPVRNLSVGQQQRVEILKTLHRGADILILDEPTAVLTPQETDELFEVIRRVVRERGMTVIIITHKLGEVMAISDRVGVMRKGRLEGVYETAQVNERILASLMVGRDVLLEPLSREKEPLDETVIAVRDLWAKNNQNLPAVRGMSLEVHAGEIVGIAGVEGNGQSELAEAVTGMRPIQKGDITVCGRSVRGMKPGAIRALGLSHVPEDRIATGVSVKADIPDNLIIGKQRRAPFAWLRFHRRKRQARKYAAGLAEDFDIRGGGLDTEVGALSGGNMQKVVLAREFSFESRALVIAQPTRGVDVGAMDFIHQRIMDKRNQGCAILLVSADLDELFRLSDRMLTVYEGRITGEFDPAKATREEVGRCMMGEEQTAFAPEAADGPAAESTPEPAKAETAAPIEEPAPEPTREAPETADGPAAENISGLTAAETADGARTEPVPGPERTPKIITANEAMTDEMAGERHVPAEPGDQHRAGSGRGGAADAGDGTRSHRGLPGDDRRRAGQPVDAGHDPAEQRAGQYAVPVFAAHGHGPGYGRRIRRRALQRRRARPDLSRRAGRRVSRR